MPQWSLELLKLESLNFACRYIVLNVSLRWQTTPKRDVVRVLPVLTSYLPVFFLNFARNHIFVIGEARYFKFCILIDTEEYEFMRDLLLPKRMCSESRDLFKFWQISDNISEMVQGRDTVAMED